MKNTEYRNRLEEMVKATAPAIVAVKAEFAPKSHSGVREFVYANAADACVNFSKMLLSRIDALPEPEEELK